MKNNNWFLILAPLVGGSVSGLVSNVKDASSLRRPRLSPPDWVFGPVWTILYLMMGYAANIVASSSSGKVPVIFWIQLALNLIWSPIYFKKRDPKLAFKVISALWVSIVLTIIEFNKVNAFAAKLLVPYLAWVTFATYLNFDVASF